MAIYHCSIKIIGRSGGRSAVACAAYRAGEKLCNEETGIMHDYSHKGGVIMTIFRLSGERHRWGHENRGAFALLYFLYS